MCNKAKVRLLIGLCMLATGVGPAFSGPEDSPIAGSRALAPVVRNYFEGKLRPVAELVMRKKIENAAATETGIPIEPLKYDNYEFWPRKFRDGRERTVSGIWKLSVYYGAVESELLSDKSTEETLYDFGKGLDRWVQFEPNSPTPIIYNSIALLSYARAVLVLRSTTETLTSERLEAHAARLKNVKSYMIEHKAVGSKDPHWYHVFLDIESSVCSDLGEIEKIVQEGSERYPDYYQIYFMGIYAAVHCSKTVDQYADLVKRIVDRGVQQTSAADGDGFYARAYWYASNFTRNGSPADVPKIEWERMKRGMADVLKRYDEPWNVNNFAKFACAAGDKETLRQLLPRALSAPISSVWGQTEYVSRCMELAGLESSAAN